MQKGRLTGKTVGGYHLLKLLGAGAVGSVYYGYHSERNLHAAVKILSPTYIDTQPKAIERFMLEAKTVAGLHHPHIIQIHDYGSDHEHQFIAMQLLTGGTLEERLDIYLSQSKFPSLGEVSQLLQQLASALTYAHNRNIIHRDVKSSNVMFDGQGTAFLVDFGIVKLLDGSTSLTSSNVVIGTPAYMSPEQWLGEELTAATDQYALGALVYLLLTGVLPFNSTSLQTSMYKQVNEAPEPLHTRRKDIPEVISNVVGWALAKDPLDRYPTVNDFAETFHNAIQGFDQEPTGFFTFSLHTEDTPVLGASPLFQLPSTQIASVPVAASQLATAQLATPQFDQKTSAVRLKVPKPKMTANVLLRLSLGVGAGLILFSLCAIAAFFGILPTLQLEATAILPSSIPGTPIPVFSLTSTALKVLSVASPTLLQPTATTGKSQITASNALQVAEIAVLQTNNTSVRSVAFDPAGTLLATGGNSNTIQIWEVNSGTLFRTLSGHQDVIYSLAFSPDGSLIASASGDGTVILWDTTTGQQRYILTGHSGEVRQVAFHPAGMMLISVGEDQTIRGWDTQSGTLINEFRGSGNRILCAAFSPDGSHLATGWSASEISLREGADFEQQRLLSGHGQEVRTLDFNAQGTLLASGSADNTIRLWNIATGTTELIMNTSSELLLDVAFSPDASLVASGDTDNMIALWDAKNGAQLAQLAGHAGWVFEVQFSLDGSVLASASGDGQVRLWGIR